METKPPFVSVVMMMVVWYALIQGVLNRTPVQYFSDGDVVMLIYYDNHDDDDQPDTPARAGFTDGGTEVVCILLAVE